MSNVCYFTLNNGEHEDIKIKKPNKNKQHNTIRERSIDNLKEKNKNYTLSSLCFENKECFHCMLDKCDNPNHNEKKFPINLSYFIQKPLRINILNNILNNNSLDFPKGYRIIYNICKFIYTNKNCKNCEEGRHRTVMIKDKEIPYCFSDFQKNESETSIRIGLHLDIMFSENCKNKKINIYDIEPISIQSISILKDKKNNYQKKKEECIINNNLDNLNNLENYDSKQYSTQKTPTFDYINAVKKNTTEQYSTESSKSIEIDQSIRSTLSLSPIEVDMFNNEDDQEIIEINQSYESNYEKCPYNQKSNLKENYSESSLSDNNTNDIVKQLQEEKHELKQKLCLLQMELDLKNNEYNILNQKIINYEKDLINRRKDYSKKIGQLESLKNDSDILGNAVVEQWLNTKLSEYQIY